MTLHRLTIPLLLFSVALLGCESAQHISRGDDALRAGHARQALAHYQRAGQTDSRLHGDPVFREKLREASWRAALDDAEDAARAGQWEKAVAKYDETLKYQPGHPEASAAIGGAKLEASKLRYQRALQAADRGDLTGAAGDLRQAIEWDANHADARAALNSLDRRGNPASEQRFAAALALIEQRDWQRAADDLAALIATDTNYLPARARLAEASAAMAESRKAHETASRLYSEKKLDDALAAAKRSLDIWPTNAEARDLQSRAQADRDRAEQLFSAAKQFAGEGNYDGAVASTLQALEVYPHHAAARKYSTEVKQIAADAHVAKARQQLQDGEIEAAAGSFRAALAFVPNHRPASDGLVDVAYAHGQGAEKEGLWGNALLWYMDAASQKPTGVYKQAEERARAVIAQRVAFDLALTVADGRGNTNADTTELHKQLVAVAGKGKPAFVSITGPAAGAEPMPRPLFKAMVTLRSIQVQQQVLGRERKEHSYNAVRAVPNPALPGLEQSLIDAERELGWARSRLIRYDCGDCRGRGHTVCSTCRGTKRHDCSACGGSGRVKVKGGSYEVCGKCGGRPSHACHTCNGAGHLRCGRCGGRGFFNDYDHSLIRAKQREVDDLRHRLRHEPATIQEQYVVKWPYEQEVYQKTGRLDAALRVEDSAGGEVQAIDVTPSYTKQDAVTINANPQVGLPADGLDLPTDDAVYRSLLDEAAKNAMTNALGAATAARANAYIAEANEHAKAGKADLDIEARVAAMVLLEATQPAEAKRLLNEIRSGK